MREALFLYIETPGKSWGFLYVEVITWLEKATPGAGGLQKRCKQR